MRIDLGICCVGSDYTLTGGQSRPSNDYSFLSVSYHYNKSHYRSFLERRLPSSI